MANVITNIFKAKDLRNKILFTLWILVVYRIGSHIPIPGINVDALEKFFESSASGAMGGLVNYFDLFAGGAFKRFTVFSLGIMPYISASIILQLLTIVIPSFEKMKKEGPEGQKKIQKYTKYLTVVLCLFQAASIAMWLKQSGEAQGLKIVPGDAGFTFFLITSVTITTGTMVLMWLGEQITERGIGNGISLIIYAGIIVKLPSALAETGNRIFSSSDPITALILIVILFGVIAASILLTLGRRNIPIQYGKRTVGGSTVGGAAQHLPIPVNAGGVIPIIFAVAIMQFPAQITNMLSSGASPKVFGYDITNLILWVSPGHIPYYFIYIGLIVFFCYFYASIQFNPVDVATNLQKYQGFVPGIRPGVSTSDYLMKVLNRLTLSGSLFLAFIAIVPDIMLKMYPDRISPSMAYMFGGTSLLIIVGVALDTLKQLESQLLMRHYDGFFKNIKMKGRR